MSRFVNCKDMNRVIKALVDDGWEFSKGAHGRLTHPSGKYVTFSSSPSDRYAFKQLERDVRRLVKQIRTRESS